MDLYYQDDSSNIPEESMETAAAAARPQARFYAVFFLLSSDLNVNPLGMSPARYSNYIAYYTWISIFAIRIATIGSMRKSDDDDDDSTEEGQAFYTGGSEHGG